MGLHVSRSKGRLIVCDQYGGLYRLTLPSLGKTEAPRIEKIDVPIGEAQGLLWAFDSLYVNVNKGGKYETRPLSREGHRRRR